MPSLQVQVDRVVVAALVAQRQAIALADLGGEQRIGGRPGFSVDGPAVIAAMAARHFFEDQIETFVR